MKKVLLTIALSILMIIPISINAELTCTYNPVNPLGDNYGEYTITKKDDGSFVVNDMAFSGKTIDLKRKLNNADLYFAGDDAHLNYYNIDADAVYNSLNDYCKQFEKGSCPDSSKNNSRASFHAVTCVDQAAAGKNCKLKGNTFWNKTGDFLAGGLYDASQSYLYENAGGNLRVLTNEFKGNTCPTLKFIADYDDASFSKMYIVLLGSIETSRKQGLVAVANGTPKNASDEINITTVYYSEATGDDKNLFSNVSYNKATGNLKLKMNDYFSSDEKSIVPTNGVSTTVKLNNSINFVNVNYDYLQFVVYGNLKSKLDNWANDERLYVMFSDGQMGTLTHYLVAEDDLVKFCTEIWGNSATAENPECQKTASSAIEKGDEENGPRTPVDLTNFDIELIPFCADNSGALTVFKIIGYALFVIKILVPIALIIFGSLDFFKVVIGNNADDMSKAVKSLIQRGIIALLVFLAPGLIRYFVGLIGNSITSDDSYFKNCNTCLLKPDECPARKTYQVTEKK